MIIRIIKNILILLFVSSFAYAQKNLSFSKQWRIEAEDASSKVTYVNNTIDIVAPKGLTLWNTNLMEGDVTIEYEAQIVTHGGSQSRPDSIGSTVSRLSDLNCFWLATDPSAKDGSVFANLTKRGGIFARQTSLQLYYLGYGGNYNSTTRFRRYSGNDAQPPVLREYTDQQHLLQPNHWYKIRISTRNGRVEYTIDGQTIVSYIDLQPLRRGYFGFRTTLSHAQLRNFRYSTHSDYGQPVALRWIDGHANSSDTPQTWGVPYAKGELSANASLSLTDNRGNVIDHDEWTLASWPDGSVKWKAVAAVIPSGTTDCQLTPERDVQRRKRSNCATTSGSMLRTTATHHIISLGSQDIYIPVAGGNFIDSIVNKTTVASAHKAMGSAWMECNGRRCEVKRVNVEQHGRVRTVIKCDGDIFSLRLYAYKGSDEVKIVHTLIVDSILNCEGLKSLALRFNVPMNDVDYKRAVVFGKDTTSAVQYMHVKPLVARREIVLDESGNPATPQSRQIVSDIASWDGFRLSQLSPNGFSVRKRATSRSPWIGTIEGHRAPGYLALGDTRSHVRISLEDFWQSYPSTLQVDNARSEEACATVWLWSPEAEPMSFEHYDTIPHGLNAAYEDIQPGMSTAYGIARTSTLYLSAIGSGIERYDRNSPLYSTSASASSKHPQLAVTPEYLHRKRAFGIWSLPGKNEEIDGTINRITDLYLREIDQQGWYGYFNHGDFMHSYDSIRGEWRYDVGGYAWDNTELATNAMLWYSFLRRGDRQLWDMAVAMSRHTGEVDCYHVGPNAPLGSRHNVSHWGCGAKEARISQAFFNRFLYYLTADERSGDLMKEVVDANQLLYHLDPMRLAQPRSAKTPCTAPARLRIGPDWLAYAGNWFTEYERTGNSHYLNKILSGMKSINEMPHGIFTGPKALGYYPETGRITWEGDTAMQNTNHLLSIMGGFEMMNEMMLSIDDSRWHATWLDHARNYKQKALEISRNKFLIPRLQAYAYWQTGIDSYREGALTDLLRHTPFMQRGHFFTNDAATWVLDAILIEEVVE